MAQAMTIEGNAGVATAREFAVPGGREIPTSAQMVMSAMEAGRAAGELAAADRRGGRRRTYRVAGALWLFSDPPSAPATVIYTRDVSRRGLGFITTAQLPLGHGGIVELVAPDGTVLNLHCTLLRCRQAIAQWYEGTLHFNRDQPQFDAE